jgi:hypothetical protein
MHYAGYSDIFELLIAGDGFNKAVAIGQKDRVRTRRDPLWQFRSGEPGGRNR